MLEQHLDSSNIKVPREVSQGPEKGKWNGYIKKPSTPAIIAYNLMREDLFFWQRSTTRSRTAKSKSRSNQKLMHEARRWETNSSESSNEKYTLYNREPITGVLDEWHIAQLLIQCSRPSGGRQTIQPTAQKNQHKSLKHKAGITNIKLALCLSWRALRDIQYISD